MCYTEGLLCTLLTCHQHKRFLSDFLRFRKGASVLEHPSLACRFLVGVASAFCSSTSSASSSTLKKCWAEKCTNQVRRMDHQPTGKVRCGSKAKIKCKCMQCRSNLNSSEEPDKSSLWDQIAVRFSSWVRRDDLIWCNLLIFATCESLRIQCTNVVIL